MPAILQPTVLPKRIVGCGKQSILMIALQAYHSVSANDLHLHKKGHDAAAVWSTVDVVAEEDKLRLPLACRAATLFDEISEGIQVPVDIAYREG